VRGEARGSASCGQNFWTMPSIERRISLSEDSIFRRNRRLVAIRMVHFDEAEVIDEWQKRPGSARGVGITGVPCGRGGFPGELSVERIAFFKGLPVISCWRSRRVPLALTRGPRPLIVSYARAGLQNAIPFGRIQFFDDSCSSAWAMIMLCQCLR